MSSATVQSYSFCCGTSKKLHNNIEDTNNVTLDKGDPIEEEAPIDLVTVKVQSADFDKIFKDTDVEKNNVELKEGGIEDFGEVDCGEPLEVQKLKLDFTPITGVDDDPYVQNKCVDFWKLIRSQTQMKCPVVPPGETENSAAEPPHVSEVSQKEVEDMPTPAIDWIKAGRDTMSHTFASKQVYKYCEEDNGDYGDGLQMHKGLTSRCVNYADGNIPRARDVKVESITNILCECDELTK